MITLAALLKPEHLELSPTATSRQTAIAEITGLLKEDLRVLDWNALYESLENSTECIVERDAPFCICILHARTAAVTSMVMSIGRYDNGLILKEGAPPVRYLVCVAMPPELASDYLRIIGLLARIAKDAKSEEQIHSAATPEAFLETLAQLEGAL